MWVCVLQLQSLTVGCTRFATATPLHDKKACTVSTHLCGSMGKNNVTIPADASPSPLALLTCRLCMFPLCPRPPGPLQIFPTTHRIWQLFGAPPLWLEICHALSAPMQGILDTLLFYRRPIRRGGACVWRCVTCQRRRKQPLLSLRSQDQQGTTTQGDDGDHPTRTSNRSLGSLAEEHASTDGPPPQQQPINRAALSVSSGPDEGNNTCTHTGSMWACRSPWLWLGRVLGLTLQCLVVARVYDQQ